MNRLQSILVTILILIALASCNEKKKRAKVYHDTIAINTALVIDSVIEFGDAIRSGSRSVCLSATENYLDLINRVYTTVENQGNFDNDSSMRVSAKGLLSFYKEFISYNFVPYFNAFENDSLNEYQVFITDSLHRKMMAEEVPHWSNFNNAEKKFSDKYDILSVRE